MDCIIKKRRKIRPLYDSGDTKNGWKIWRVQHWDSKKVTIEDIKKAWYAEYRPEGYDTTVEGRVEKGLLIIKIERAHSSD
ncbi:MAG: hypothetical protein US71_C0001G0006 [Parcubacteria group bacterium GW2011_GWD2_38_12]|nr:MAG: hypothetical protein US06_C0001G0006 [Parcubacteria group bacterium GW2011_GWC2_36_17]KKQ38769.1 MAG: hypothetical protein US56_C0036G0007 [Candidatus Moranbacteria bacterium GW2011_GWF2_37_7]KKQ52803.1 MAG: hypothetical protein US71_C0001G0006 [Parcubacteria group bacterium GW2011_GWD2_38_12]KKQ59007.1 MAG: hypothetical protein US79_C0001G0006 [Parcubacteria group bacterium GW2011_GWC1_38_17]KKQ59259.1 MAG: hypothetical protein US78_C0007G0019 [Parcubacteria group bacterium GW2011_GWD1